MLVVEDDVRMAAAIRRGLRFEGLVVDLAGGGDEALRLVGTTDYDASRCPRRARSRPAWTAPRRV